MFHELWYHTCLPVVGAGVVGAGVVGAGVVGEGVVGPGVVGADVVGAEVVGPRVVGAGVVGEDVVGAEVVGAGVVGAGVVGEGVVGVVVVGAGVVGAGVVGAGVVGPGVVGADVVGAEVVGAGVVGTGVVGEGVVGAIVVGAGVVGAGVVGASKASRLQFRRSIQPRHEGGRGGRRLSQFAGIGGIRLVCDFVAILPHCRENVVRADEKEGPATATTMACKLLTTMRIFPFRMEMWTSTSCMFPWFRRCTNRPPTPPKCFEKGYNRRFLLQLHQRNQFQSQQVVSARRPRELGLGSHMTRLDFVVSSYTPRYIR